MGSYAGKNLKFEAVYALLAGLLPKISSRLYSIIFNMLFRTENRKSNNHAVFGTLIEELNFLQDKGISITVNENRECVKF